MTELCANDAAKESSVITLTHEACNNSPTEHATSHNEFKAMLVSNLF